MKIVDMRVIIAGSRSITYPAVGPLVARAVLASGWADKITEVLTGRARGVDMAGEDWARRRGLVVVPYYPDWKRYGKAAGPIRNGEMAKDADALIAVWDGESSGTKDMITQMTELGKPVYIFSTRE